MGCCHFSVLKKKKKKDFQISGRKKRSHVLRHVPSMQETPFSANFHFHAKKWAHPHICGPEGKLIIGKERQ
jgi:hypothetical protein